MTSGAIFLSASVPDATRFPQYAETADVVAIGAAVNAVVQVVLGRRRLVWGGHPAITPIIHLVAQSMNVDYDAWVHLYQSRFFEGQFPDDNAKFANVSLVEAVAGDREQSLLKMRTEMFSSSAFEGAVFIGGMQGIVDEYRLFARLRPDARCVPLYSTGGATLALSNFVYDKDPELATNLDYVALLHRKLEIAPGERRYPTPKHQPASAADRLRARAGRGGGASAP